MNETRLVERLVKNKWESVDFMSLRQGDVFRLFESDGTLVLGPTHESVAESDAYVNNIGVGEIKCVPFDGLVF